MDRGVFRMSVAGRENSRDHIIRMLANWVSARLTGKRAPRSEVVLFLAELSPEERFGIYKLRTFSQRYNRGRRQRPIGIEAG